MISYGSISDFPIIGSENTYYRDESNNKIYQWSGSNYIQTNGGGGGGQVDSVVAGTNVSVDNADPANPIISVPEKTSVARTKALEVFIPNGSFNTLGVEHNWSMGNANIVTSDVSWDPNTAIATINTPGHYHIISNPLIDEPPITGNNRKIVSNNIRVSYGGLSDINTVSIYLRYISVFADTRLTVSRSAYLPVGATIETFLLITSEQSTNNVDYKSVSQAGNRGFVIIKEERS